MTLLRRLLLGTALVISLTGAALLYSIVDHDVRAAHAEMERDLRHELEFIAPAVTEQALIGDYAVIEQMLRVRLAQPVIARAAYVDARGTTLEVSKATAAARVPAWFARWAGMEALERSESLVVGGVGYGRVSVLIDPAPTVEAIWRRSSKLLQILLLGLSALLALTWLLATSGLRPLGALADAARRFGAGDHGVRLNPSGPPDVAATLRAFNSLADDVQRLLKSLEENRTVLHGEKERAQVTLASIADAVVSADARGRIEYINPVGEKLTGWSAGEARGRPLEEVLRVVDEASGLLLPPPTGAGGPVALQGRALEPRRGGRIPIELSVAPIFDRERASAGVVVVFRDVSESRRLTERLSWQATHDALTGLVNRREFERRLELLVEQATVDENEHALLYMDLDQFKVVNDSCGHAAGDALLRLVTATLAQAVRHSDTLARLGGDEFGVLLPGCALEKATSVAEQLRRAVHELSFAWEGKTFRVAASVGVVEIGSGSASGSRLLEAADTACYSAKDKGRNRVQAFKPDDAELALRRGEMQWIARIRSALDEDRLRLYCQRIGPLSPGAPTGDYFEVLIRLLDENGNLVPPMAFIPAAERFNLMPEIDRYVIRKSFEALAGLPAAPLLAINLSGASFSETGLLDYIKAQFERHRVMPERICFEITETAAIANLEAASRLIHDLRALGCRFSLDDFGSGLSSFGYLKGLSVDQLKIDGRFVRDIAKDPIDAAMVRAIHDIGHVMGLRTVAEWVENDETIAVLRAIGVDYIQGYGVEKPKPIEEALGAARNASAGKTACASSAR